MSHNYLICVDVSGSMNERDGQKTSRIQRVAELTVAAAYDLEERDDDGIDVFFFGTRVEKLTGVSAKVVEERFKSLECNQGTDLELLVKEVIEHYKKGARNDKQYELTAIIITDGEPSSNVAGQQRSITKMITDLANTLQYDGQCNFQFWQIGTDKNAAKFLTGLDNMKAKLDIVDVKTFQQIIDSGMTMDELMDEAING
jgi:Mg-chelatase subunit ChlD